MLDALALLTESYSEQKAYNSAEKHTRHQLSLDTTDAQYSDSPEELTGALTDVEQGAQLIITDSADLHFEVAWIGFW